MIPRLALRSGPVRLMSTLLMRCLLTSNNTGKDYSNPRILDFHTLNRPEEDMYDRTKIPRMPWFVVVSRKISLCLRFAPRHDVGMQVVGQPARDLCRHFVQRCVTLFRLWMVSSSLSCHLGGIICCESKFICLVFNFGGLLTTVVESHSCHAFPFAPTGL